MARTSGLDLPFPVIVKESDPSPLAGCLCATGMEGALVEHVRAEPFHRVTPLLESWALSQVAGMPVFLKYENVQPAGSFKIRGIGHFCQQVKEGGHGLGWGRRSHRAVEEVWAGERERNVGCGWSIQLYPTKASMTGVTPNSILSLSRWP